MSKKQLRQQQAQRRERLKPLYDIVRKAENELATTRTKLEAVETSLADGTIYTDPDRQSELAEHLKKQASLKSDIDNLESKWMEATETLESAD